jgi:hypothetical protein
MQSLLQDEQYGTKEYAKVVLQKNQGQDIDNYIRNVMIPAFQESNDQLFLKKHLHTISLV